MRQKRIMRILTHVEIIITFWYAAWTWRMFGTITSWNFAWLIPQFITYSKISDLNIDWLALTIPITLRRFMKRKTDFLVVAFCERTDTFTARGAGETTMGNFAVEWRWSCNSCCAIRKIYTNIAKQCRLQTSSLRVALKNPQ